MWEYSYGLACEYEHEGRPVGALTSPHSFRLSIGSSSSGPVVHAWMIIAWYQTQR